MSIRSSESPPPGKKLAQARVADRHHKHVGLACMQPHIKPILPELHRLENSHGDCTNQREGIADAPNVYQTPRSIEELKRACGIWVAVSGPREEILITTSGDGLRRLPDSGFTFFDGPDEIDEEGDRYKSHSPEFHGNAEFLKHLGVGHEGQHYERHDNEVLFHVFHFPAGCQCADYRIIVRLREFLCGFGLNSLIS